MNTDEAKQASTIDSAQLRALLKCYFRLGIRGRLTKSFNRQGEQRSEYGMIFLAVFMYAAMGLIVGLSAFSGLDVFTYSTIIHSMTLMVAGMAVTSESGDILFNRNESDVLLHRPIHPRTLLLAKSLNLIFFALLFSGAVNLGPTFLLGLYCAGAQSWFPFTHILAVVCDSIFCSAAVVCIYGVIVRFFDRDKFDNFAAWSQVAMSMLFIAANQLLPQMMHRFKGVSFTKLTPYLAPFPPAWFAALDAALAGSQAQRDILLLGGAGLAVTALLAYTAIGKLAPDYGEALAKLNEARATKIGPSTGAAARPYRFSPVLRTWLRDPIERSSFLLARAYMARDRDVKLRLYPSICYVVVMPLVGLFNKNRTDSFMPLMGVWMLGVMPISALETLRITSNPAAAEIFSISPLESAASVFHGVRKAVIYYLVIPAICAISLLFALLFPNGCQLLLLGIPTLIALPTISLTPSLFASEGYLPLSRQIQAGGQASRNGIFVMGTMFASAGLSLMAWLSWSANLFWPFVAVEAVILALLHWQCLRGIRSHRLTIG